MQNLISYKFGLNKKQKNEDEEKRTDFFEDMSVDNKPVVYLIGAYVQHHFTAFSTMIVWLLDHLG